MRLARSQFQCNRIKSNKSLAEQATGGLLQLPLDPAQQPEQLAPTCASIQEANQAFESFLPLSQSDLIPAFQ